MQLELTKAACIKLSDNQVEMSNMQMDTEFRTVVQAEDTNLAVIRI